MHPFRTYMASVLYQDIDVATTHKALDAGAGQLRYYFTFQL